MSVTNNMVLRPRFKLKLGTNNKTILKDFEALKSIQSEFIITRLDNHVFIKFPTEKQHFWSPQLHLEIDEVNEDSCLLNGLFGPNPTVWTLFMFLHFMVAGLFIAFGIWAYTNWRLKTEYAIQLSLVALMVIIWFVLYFAGRIGKASSKKDMQSLNNFMYQVIDKKILIEVND